MISGGAPRSTSIAFCRASDAMGLSGVLLGLALLVWLAFRGWSVLLLAPLAALLMVVAFFVLAPMAEALFRGAAIPRRLMPAAIALGTSTFTMSALPGTPAIQNAIPMPFFGTTAFAAPGLGVIAAAIMLGFGLWWLERAAAAARRRGEGFGSASSVPVDAAADDPMVRERTTTAHAFDPVEIHRAARAEVPPIILLAALPLAVVVAVNLLMSFVILPRMDTAFLAEPRWGMTSLSAVGGVWSVAVALAAAIITLLLATGRRLPALRGSRRTPTPVPPCYRRFQWRAWWASAPSSRRCRPSS